MSHSTPAALLVPENYLSDCVRSATYRRCKCKTRTFPSMPALANRGEPPAREFGCHATELKNP